MVKKVKRIVQPTGEGLRIRHNGDLYAVEFVEPRLQSIKTPQAVLAQPQPRNSAYEVSRLVLYSLARSEECMGSATLLPRNLYPHACDRCGSGFLSRKEFYKHLPCLV